jgi:hypothetical protein
VEAAVTCSDLMARLLALRTALPGANVSALVARHPQILQQSGEQIQHAADVVGAAPGAPARLPAVQAGRAAASSSSRVAPDPAPPALPSCAAGARAAG